MKKGWRRGFWGLGGQALSSASSLILAVMVSRHSSPETVGAWAVAYGVYTFVLALTRNVVSTPVLVQPAGAGRSGLAGVVSLSLMVGLIAGGFSVVVGFFLSGTSQEFLILHGAMLPLLLTQDAIRYWKVRHQKPQVMAVMDFVWLVLQLFFGLIALRLGFGGLGVVVAWACAGLFSLLVGIVSEPIVPGLKSCVEFLREHGRAIRAFFWESLIASSAANGLPVVLGAVLGLTATGYFRGGLTLLGIAGVVVLGVTPIATVELAKRSNRDGVFSRFVLSWSVGMVLLGIFFLVAIRTLGDDLGLALLGETWVGTAAVVLPFSLQLMTRGPFISVPIILRVTREYAWLIRGRVLSGLLTVMLTSVGGLTWGLLGAAWLWCASGALSSVAYLAIFLVLRRSRV